MGLNILSDSDSATIFWPEENRSNPLQNALEQRISTLFIQNLTVGFGEFTRGLMGPRVTVPQAAMDLSFAEAFVQALMGPQAAANPELAKTLLANLDPSVVAKLLQAIGDGVIGQELMDPTPIGPYDKFSRRFQIDGIEHPICQIGFINGMGASFAEVAEEGGLCSYLQDLSGGIAINGVYNYSNGNIADVFEVLLMQYLGISPKTAPLLLQTWTEFDAAHQGNLKAKYLQICHSMSAIEVRNALESAPQFIRDRVIVLAIAPAAIVPKELCFYSANYASKTDLVPEGEVAFGWMLNILGGLALSTILLKALDRRKQLILLDPPEGASGFNHDFPNPIFRTVIREFIQDYLARNGEYRTAPTY